MSPHKKKKKHRPFIRPCVPFTRCRNAAVELRGQRDLGFRGTDRDWNRPDPTRLDPALD